MAQRIEPLPAEEWGDAEYAAFGVIIGRAAEDVPRAGSGEKFDPLNFPMMGVLAHHPDLAKVFLRFNGFQLFRGSLSVRLRELAILRVAQTYRSHLEWSEHVKIALDNGITTDEIDALAVGNDNFDGDDLAVLEAVDELLADRRMGSTWERLVETLGKRPAIELIFVVGTYGMLASAFETWGLSATPDAAPLPPVDT